MAARAMRLPSQRSRGARYSDYCRQVTYLNNITENLCQWDGADHLALIESEMLSPTARGLSALCSSITWSTTLTSGIIKGLAIG
jgi:hypothetical protein